MQVDLAYDSRTAILSTFSTSALDFATNVRRAPVSFSGQVRNLC